MGIHLCPEGGVDCTYLLDLCDELLLFAMLRQREEQVQLIAPLDLDPVDTVVVNHRLDDVVVLESPLRRDLSLQLVLTSRNVDGLVVVAHG